MGVKGLLKELPAAFRRLPPPGPTAMNTPTRPWGAATAKRALVAPSRRSLSTTEPRAGARPECLREEEPGGAAAEERPRERLDAWLGT